MQDSFVGRQRELKALQRAFDQAGEGVGGITMLAGEPGIGKTWTIRRFAAEAVD